MSMLPKMNYKNAEEMMNKVDSNKDGVITIDEMKKSHEKEKSKSISFAVGITILLSVIIFAVVYSYFSKYRKENCLHRRFVSLLSYRRKPLELS